MKYRILSAGSCCNLSTDVNNWIELGWVPQGGVAVIRNSFDSGCTYIQAMIHTET